LSTLARLHERSSDTLNPGQLERVLVVKVDAEVLARLHITRAVVAVEKDVRLLGQRIEPFAEGLHGPPGSVRQFPPAAQVQVYIGWCRRHRGAGAALCRPRTGTPVEVAPERAARPAVLGSDTVGACQVSRMLDGGAAADKADGIGAAGVGVSSTSMPKSRARPASLTMYPWPTARNFQASERRCNTLGALVPHGPCRRRGAAGDEALPGCTGWL